MALNSNYINGLYKRATAFVCICNLVAFFYILNAVMRPFYFYTISETPSSSWGRTTQGTQTVEREAARVKEAFEARQSLEPIELIKRVKEIQAESGERQHWRIIKKKEVARELADKLKKLREANTKTKDQALKQWRKKKLKGMKLHESGTRYLARSQTSFLPIKTGF